jgi:hypothetical protein
MIISSLNKRYIFFSYNLLKEALNDKNIICLNNNLFLIKKLWYKNFRHKIKFDWICYLKKY